MKIITAGYYDDKEDSLHVLSDKDSEVFRNMIVSIIVRIGFLYNHSYYSFLI